jgi:predicted metal-binding protein
VTDTTVTNTMTKPILHICTTCRGGHAEAEGAKRRGQVLFDAVADLLADENDVDLRGVECLAICAQGCSAALAMPGRWSYLLHGLEPDHAADLLVYARSYAASATGTVMPSRRPASLRDVIHGRVPA